MPILQHIRNGSLASPHSKAGSFYIVMGLQFQTRLKLFMEGVRDYPLDDHSLVGTMKGLRAFSNGGDVRVVYRETDEHYEFLDIGFLFINKILGSMVFHLPSISRATNRGGILLSRS